MTKLPDNIFEDEEFGHVYVFLSPRISYGRVKFEVENGDLLAKANLSLPLSKIVEALASLRPRIRAMMGRAKKRLEKQIPLNFGTIINAYPYCIKLQQGQSLSSFSAGYSKNEGCYVVICPFDMNFEDSSHIRMLRKALVYVLRSASKFYIPQRVKELAQKCGFQYKSIGFTDAIGRWGSCSSRGSLNFSVWTLLLGKELIDSVIIHELCHTVEMNHSDKFWNLFESHYGKPRKLVDNEIKNVVLPKFVQMK